MRQKKCIVSLGLVAWCLIGFPALAQQTLPNALTSSRIAATKVVLAVSRSKQKTDSLQRLTQPGYYSTLLTAQRRAKALARARIAAESCTSYLCTVLSVSLTASGPLTCKQPEATLTVVGGLVNSTYVFSTGAKQPAGPTSNTATVTTAGAYSVTVTAPNGATATASVTVTQGADLTPILYARPSTVNGTAEVTVVVDVLELNSMPTSGTLTVKVTRDNKVSLSLPASATLIDNRPVQNTAWSFSAPDPFYYVLTTNQVIAADGMLSFGLIGKLTPEATTGFLSISSTIMSGSGCEVKGNNNTDADQIDYFQQ